MHKVTQFDTIPVTIGSITMAVGHEEVSRNTVWHVTWWLVETHHAICWLANWTGHVMLGLWLVGAQGGELTFTWSVRDQCMHTESLNVRRCITKNQAVMACFNTKYIHGTSLPPRSWGAFISTCYTLLQQVDTLRFFFLVFSCKI